MKSKWKRSATALLLVMALVAAGLVVSAPAADAAVLPGCPALVVQGASGSCVVGIQQALDAHGAGLTADGFYGPLTTAAVRAFQASVGLSPDGEVGPLTSAALSGGAAPVPTGPADPATAPYSGPVASGPAPFPAPQTVSESGADDCGFIAPQIMEGEFYNPRISDDNRVEDMVVIDLTNAGCGDWAEVILQSKHCGFWGCTWTDESSFQLHNMPANGWVATQLVSMPRRSGINSYRLELDAHVFKLAAEEGPNEDAPGAIGTEADTEVTYSNTIKM